MIVLRKLLEDDLKKTETCCILNGLCVEVYILILVNLLVLSTKLLTVNTTQLND